MNEANAKLIRTDFGDDEKWLELQGIVGKPDKTYGFQAYIEFVNDSTFLNNTKKEIKKKLDRDYDFNFYFVADKTTFESADSPILCVKIPSEFSPGEDSFRVLPKDLWVVENNLSISNMDFEEFSSNLDPNGIFRGF